MNHGCVTHPTHDSIFGDTYHGVPNPLVPHLHPYPTRFHGPMYQVPMATFPYRERPYAVPPYAGYDGMGSCGTGCGCPANCSCPSCVAKGCSGLSGTEDRPPLLRSVTGNTVLDSIVGAGFGYLVAPNADEKLLWTGVGAVATGLAGMLGLLGTVGGALVIARDKGRRTT